MHAGAIRTLLYGFASVCAIIHPLFEARGLSPRTDAQTIHTNLHILAVKAPEMKHKQQNFHQAMRTPGRTVKPV